jgi:hypothetical protein
MDNWLEMRRRFEAYTDFYTYIVKAIVGKRNFKKRLRTMAEGAEIVTVSDEALASWGGGAQKGHIQLCKKTQNSPKNNT